MHKKILLWASILGALAVAFGAFGAHIVKSKLALNFYENYQTAVQYHFYHVFALLLCGLLYRAYRHIYFVAAAYFFSFGIFFFSFSLYIYALTSKTTDGPHTVFARVTPVGGVFFILGWIMLILYFFKNKEKNTVSKNKE